MDIITGYIGEPHISSEQDRDINIGIVGEGSYVLATGLRMEPEVQTGNEVRIKDGVIMHQGCAASIKKNTYDSVVIANGSQGMKRTDLIVARYQRDAGTNIESMNWVVIQGTPAETDPVVPEYVSGDIQAGDTVADMPMYKVHLDGLNITSIEKVFTVVNGLEELNSNRHKALWSGEWASGPISVPGISEYNVFEIGITGSATRLIGFINLTRSDFRGYGVYGLSDNAHRTYTVDAKVDGDNLTMVRCVSIGHSAGGDHAEAGSFSVSSIYGIA